MKLIHESLDNRTDIYSQVASTKKVRLKLHRKISTQIGDEVFKSIPLLNKPNQFNKDGNIKGEEMTKELLKSIAKPKQKTEIKPHQHSSSIALTPRQ